MASGDAPGQLPAVCMSPNGDGQDKDAQKNVGEAIFRMIHDGGKEHWHLSLLPRVSPPDPTSSDDLPINGGGDHIRNRRP